MGNTYSARTRQTLYTAAMAKFMHITKPQVITLRNTLLPYIQSTQGMIQRSHMEYSLDVGGIDTSDAKIFGLLFTLCDAGDGRVDCLEYIVGISVLACQDDSLEAALRFAVAVLDVKALGKIDSRSAFKLLRGVCAIASNFGDTVPSNRHLYKMVDAVYDAVTMMSEENDGVSHDRFVRRFMGASLLKEFVMQVPASLVSTRNLLDGLSDNDDSDIGSYQQFLPTQYTSSPQNRSILSPKSTGVQSATDDSLNSHMSSLMLTPLAQIPIS